MGWKYEYKANLWFECINKGHMPVVVRYSTSSIDCYCSECRKVWRCVLIGKLSSLEEEEIESVVKDCEWKKKVLGLMSENAKR